MGKGIDLARGQSPLHAEILDDMKDQLLIILMKRLAVEGVVVIPLVEMDDTGQDTLAFRIDPVSKEFIFNLGRKS